MAFDPYKVLSTENGVVRLFTTDLLPEGDAAITSANVQKLLGEGIELDPSKVEVFPPKAIEPIGMSTYLNEGHGIPEEALEGKSAALDAMTGLVVVIPTSAFKGQEVTLDPLDGVRFVGAFHEQRAAHPKAMADPEAAEGVLSPKGGGHADPLLRHRRGWMLALAALVAAAALVLFIVF